MFYILFRTFILCILIWPFMGFAEEVYTWTDENGVMHFSHSPPELREKFEVEEIPHVAAPGKQSKKGSDNNKKSKSIKNTRTKDEWIKDCQNKFDRLNKALEELRIDHAKKIEVLESELKEAKEYTLIKKINADIEKENKRFESEEESIEINIRYINRYN